MTRGEMMSRMSARELDSWFQFNLQWPIGETRADIRAGLISSVIANAHRDPQRQIAPFAPADFMLFTDTEPISAEDLSQRFQAATGYEEAYEIPDGYNRFGYKDD